MLATAAPAGMVPMRRAWPMLAMLAMAAQVVQAELNRLYPESSLTPHLLRRLL